MKNLYVLLFCLVSVTSLSAQIQKGAVLIGGTVGFNNISEDGDGLTTINVSPLAGFLLSDRFMLGASLNFSLTATSGFNTTTIGLTPFGRYYFNGSGTTRFFGEVDLGFQNSFDDGDNTTAFVFGAGVGADFFLNDRVAIEALLSYARFQAGEDNGGGFNHIGLNIGVAAFIGGGSK